MEYRQWLQRVGDKENEERMIYVGAPGLSSIAMSDFLHSACTVQQLQENTYSMEYELQMAKKDKDDHQKRLYKLAAWSRR